MLEGQFSKKLTKEQETVITRVNFLTQNVSQAFSKLPLDIQEEERKIGAGWNTFDYNACMVRSLFSLERTFQQEDFDKINKLEQEAQALITKFTSLSTRVSLEDKPN